MGTRTTRRIIYRRKDGKYRSKLVVYAISWFMGLLFIGFPIYGYFLRTYSSTVNAFEGFKSPEAGASAVVAPSATPTNTPSPTPTLEPEQVLVEKEIRHVFGKHAEQALKVARCESGLRPKVCNDGVNKNSTVDCGTFQVNTVHKIERKWLKNYQINIRVAYQLFEEGGYHWGHWYSSKKCHGLD